MLRLVFLILSALLFIPGCRAAQPPAVFNSPIEITDNRPFVPVTINGRTYHFVIDTGGYNSIDADAARELGLELTGKFQMPGAGEKTVDAWHTELDSFSVGGSEFTKRRFYVLPLGGIKEALKLPYLDGIIGYDFFGDGVLQLDYPNKRASVINEYTGTDPIRFTIQGSHLPEIAVTANGIESRFVIDTGDRSSLTISQSFAERLGGQKPLALSDEEFTGFGLGGPIMARTFTLGSLKIGGTETHDVLTRVPTIKGGAFNRPGFNGSIGSGFLKAYRVTFDYKHGRLYLEKP
jgi:predicted aspartyl protease